MPCLSALSRLWRCCNYRLVRTEAVQVFCWEWKTSPIIAVCVCERESKTGLAKEADEKHEEEEMERRKKSSSQTIQIFTCPITAAVCNATCCVSSCLSSFVTVVIWGFNRRFLFDYPPAEVFFWWGYHFQYFRWHFVRPTVFGCVWSQYHIFSMTFSLICLLISVLMLTASLIQSVANEVDAQTRVSFEIFGNYFTSRIIFTAIHCWITSGKSMFHGHI